MRIIIVWICLMYLMLLFNYEVNSKGEKNK